MNIRTVGIMADRHDARAVQAAMEVFACLRDRHVEALLESELAKGVLQAESGVPKEDLGICSDLLVVVGQGSMLRAAALIAGERDVPILAVDSDPELPDATRSSRFHVDVQRALAGDLVTERRTVLAITILRRRRPVVGYRALNDVVIRNGVPARMIEIDILVNDRYVSTLRADGLIVATPAGSTGYNLEAGGPIVHPNLSAWGMTPICPHTLTHRPVILPTDVRIGVEFRTEKAATILGSIDGEVRIGMTAGDGIEIRAAPDGVRWIVPANGDYFGILRNRLHWN